MCGEQRVRVFLKLIILVHQLQGFLLIPTTTVEGQDESVLGLWIAALELPQFLNAEPTW